MYTVAAGGTIRALRGPVQLGGHDIPSGSIVQVPFHGIHRNPAVWDRPDDFLPVITSTCMAHQAHQCDRLST